MQVFVAGATGAIGQYLIPSLLAAGHEVTGTTRSPSKASQLNNAGATPAIVDGLDRQAVLSAVKAAQQAGTRRFIAQSFIGWNNARTGSQVKTEQDPLDPDPLPATRQSMTAIRHVEETVPGAVPEGLVLRYGMFYGPGASESMLDVVKKRRMPVVGG